MKIYLTPQISNDKSVIKINDEKVQVDGALYDFTNLPNGVLRNATGSIINAKRVDGELHVEIINRLDDTAMQYELFPQWQTVERTELLDDNLTLVQLDWCSDDERFLDEFEQSLKPSQEELEQAKFELKTITLLVELGVI